jgi:phosphoribosylanthranilate isomerase
MLAGGLTQDNLKDALSLFDPDAVDVSSGVESDGMKDPDKISAFLKAAAD